MDVPEAGGPAADSVALADTALAPPAGSVPKGRPDPAAPRTVSVYLQEGASADDRATVVAHAEASGLTVEAGPYQGVVRLTGSTADLERCFSTSLSSYATPDGTVFDVPDTPLRLPAAVAEPIAGVFGLDTRPIARPRP